MLVLGRGKGQWFCIGNGIRIVCVRSEASKYGQIGIGIDAPKGVPILRNEHLEAAGCREYPFELPDYIGDPGTPVLVNGMVGVVALHSNGALGVWFGDIKDGVPLIREVSGQTERLQDDY